MEKIYARYVPYGKGMDDALLNGARPYMTLDTETDATVKAEMAAWVIRDFCKYSYYDDDYDRGHSGTSTNEIAVDKMVSRSSGCYSTSDVIGDILVEDGHFAGVVLYITEDGGNGWSNYDRKGYCLLLIDGSVKGNPEKSHSFSDMNPDRALKICRGSYRQSRM